jgi:hypothetical protein
LFSEVSTFASGHGAEVQLPGPERRLKKRPFTVAVAAGSTAEWTTYRVDNLEFEVPSSWKVSAKPSIVSFESCERPGYDRFRPLGGGSFAVPGCIEFGVYRKMVASEKDCRERQVPFVREFLGHLGPQSLTEEEASLGGAPATRFEAVKTFQDETSRRISWTVCRGTEFWDFFYVAPDTEDAELQRAHDQLVRTAMWR